MIAKIKEKAKAIAEIPVPLGKVLLVAGVLIAAKVIVSKNLDVKLLIVYAK